MTGDQQQNLNQPKAPSLPPTDQGKPITTVNSPQATPAVVVELGGLPEKKRSQSRTPKYLISFLSLFLIIGGGLAVYSRQQKKQLPNKGEIYQEEIKVSPSPSVRPSLMPSPSASSSAQPEQIGNGSQQ